jgi:hypothetical protein
VEPSPAALEKPVTKAGTSAPSDPAASARPDDGTLLALLLRPAAPAAAPAIPDPAKISGVVRRRVGRQSLLARGLFIGPGPAWAAVFKRRADTFNLAIFGEDGGLRLYQSVPWPRGARARPLSVLPIQGMDGPGHDGLLIIGTLDSPAPPVTAILQFSGRTVHTYAPE